MMKSSDAEDKRDGGVRYIAGRIAPVGEARHPMSQPEPLLPRDIRRISASIEVGDYTLVGVNEAIAQRYWSCVDDLAARGAQHISLAGFPIASQLGRARILALIDETARRTGVAADAQAEATVAALKHVGARRIAVASRWSEQLNAALTDYLQHAGIEVLAMTGVGQWAQQAFSMSIEEGVKLAFQLSRQAMRQAPRADALLLPGGAWRSLAAVPILEEDFGVPVVTNPIAEVWRFIAAGIAPPVRGWGRLLAGDS
jgi:arylmalonate decarboxylase